MAFEADRMIGLSLSADIVDPERDVVLEERRMRVDSDPAAELGEALHAALFVHHPYGIPVIGWGHEIETLSQEDALAYYRRFYTPKNAILVVAGDVTAETVRALAEASYGQIEVSEAAPARKRPREPEPKVHRLLTLADEKVEQPSHQRIYLTPSCITAEPSESEALEVLAHLLGGGQTSLLYKTLVLDRQVAVSAGAYYMATALDATRFYIYAIPAPGVSLPQLDMAMDEVIDRCIAEPVSAADLVRAKTRLVAEAIYAQDSQAVLARWYGAALAIGLTIEEVRSWPDRVEAVTADRVQQAAARWLVKRRAVTGFLLPKQAA
jgi:zinc protease